MTIKSPVLQVDANAIQTLDTTNPPSSLPTKFAGHASSVFARCCDSVAQGRRLDKTSGNASPDSVRSQHPLGPKTQSQTIVTRGFSHSQIPASHITSPALKECASGSDDLEARKTAPQLIITDTAIKDNLQTPVPAGDGQEKTASLNSQVGTQSHCDESAVSDDDEDWEEDEESGSSMAEDSINFRRVNSNAYCPSQPSLLTLAFKATPNPFPIARATAHMRPMLPKVHRATARPINVTATGMHSQSVLSPRTTRRNMIATELTQSLRRHLLSEGSYKIQPDAALEPRNMAHLKQVLPKPFMKKDKDEEMNVDTNRSWEQYFGDPFAAYHVCAW